MINEKENLVIGIVVYTMAFIGMFGVVGVLLYKAITM